MPSKTFVEAHVTCLAPEAHLATVELAIPALARPGERTLLMPRWIPGSYMIRDFGRHVQDVEVLDGDGKPLRVRRERTDGWTFRDPGHGRLTVRYRVYGRDLSVQSAHITHTHAALVGTTLFLYDEHVRDLPWRLRLEVPDDWGIWSGLPQEGPKKGITAPGRWPPEAVGKATFLADDYDHLVDCPIETGDHHQEERFLAGGKPTRLVVWNPPEGVDWDQVTDDLKRLIEEAAALFDGLPYDDYTFIAHCAQDHGGGLEHRNSTTLGCDPLFFTDKKTYQTRWLPLCAHEFFHTWNVKRIKPERFFPYDYQREVPTGLLWLMEGATSYYETPLLNRAGVLEKEHEYTDLADTIKFLEMVPGRFRLPVDDASRLSWTKLYLRHESNINTNVSYYSKGALVCLCLDAYLRDRGKSLDDVYRHLWKAYGQKEIGIPEDGVADIVKDATGIDVKSRLNAWVKNPGDLPIDRSLRTLGLSIDRDHSDKDATHGFGVHLAEDALEVRAVADRWDGKDTPGDPKDPGDADLPMLDPGDEILAVDGWKVTHKNLGKVLATKDVDTPVEVTLFRDGRLAIVETPLVEKQKDKIKIEDDKDAKPEAKRRRARWKRSLVKKKVRAASGGKGKSGAKKRKGTRV